MPISCSAENVVEDVAEECTQNGIEDMDVDGAKGGSDDENEVVGTVVQDAETEELKPEVVGVETEVNNGADDDEVKEHDGDDEINCFESAPQVEQTLTNLEITLTPDAENASTQNVPTPSHETIFIPPSMSNAFRPPPLMPQAPIRIIMPDEVFHNKN
ncbi:hypothetical protein JHK87_027870 [Glycine soja]|nr:hypothetical protein JHK87_027870 [Glycine soja]